MAALLGVSRSGYYRYREHAESQHSRRDTELLIKIKAIYQSNRGLYGAPRIHAELKAEGEKCGKKRVARIMKENNIIPKTVRRYKHTTKQDKRLPVAENLLDQDFSAQRPNEKWVSDITYVLTDEGWLYVAVIMDLFSRSIVGLSMNARMTKELVINALNQAILRRNWPESFVYHSDRGSQYASYEFQEVLAQAHAILSMSGAGNCYDNAAMESFNGTLKQECVFLMHYKTREEAKNHIFEYIEVFYNKIRRHSYLNHVSPEAFEAAYYASTGIIK